MIPGNRRPEGDIPKENAVLGPALLKKVEAGISFVRISPDNLRAFRDYSIAFGLPIYSVAMGNMPHE